MLDVLREMGKAGKAAYRWETKSEPLLWLADAVCGAVREHLTQTDDEWIQRLEAGADVRIHWHQGL